MCELRAFACRLPLLKGDWTNRWCPEVASDKGRSSATRTVLVSLVARHGRVLERSRFCGRAANERALELDFQQLGLAVRALEDELFETEFQEVPDFPEICADLFSVDAWHLVDYGRFVRVEDILLLETRSALRAVQSACERHRNVRILCQLNNLALVCC